VKNDVLSVKNLSVFVREPGGERAVVDGIDFELGAGEVLALVGESGCGKSKTAEALLGLVPPATGRSRADAILLDGRDIAQLGEAGRRRIRGRARRQARVSARNMLERVGIADPGRILGSYPHELSGGMRQRVVIAMAMACKPRVLLADEPTTALDVTTQAQVLSQLVRLGREEGTAILLITHDLGVVAQYCDRALVMKQGRLVEDAGVPTLFDRPREPYTRSLIAAAREMSP
jgi:peptide/nickel transport system ATP-binding protein